jgi:pimeloyl-ACP methyl ester carboxylesterase
MSIRRRVGTTALVTCMLTIGVAQGAGMAPIGIDFARCDLTGSAGIGRIEAECGALTVPEDPDDPNGSTIDLHVARIKALRPVSGIDPLTLINGGPGASSVTLLADLKPAFTSILLDRDIVVVDQRGTGRSAPLACEAPPSGLAAFDAEAIRDAARRCLDTLDTDPARYTTRAAVADLEYLREALGYRRWNIYAVSYGTRVAQHYLRRHPHAVRTMILDGVVPPDVPLGPDIALNAQHTLTRILARCTADPDCHARFPDPSGQFATLAARLKAAPVTIEIPDPVGGRHASFEITYSHLAATVRILSYAPETAALIPLVIDEAESRRNYLPLLTQAQRIERELGRAINFAMHNSVVCAEDAPHYGELPELLSALEATYLGADQMRAFAAICDLWPRGAVDPGFREHVASDVPTLLLSGEFDPITPPGYAERAAVRLTRSLHVVAPGQGHGVVIRGCIPDLVADFVRTGRVDGLNVGCVGRMRADPFFLDLMGPAP